MLRQNPLVAPNRTLPPARQRANPGAGVRTNQLVTDLLHLVLTTDLQPDTYLRQLRHLGISAEMACLEVLQPVAHRLGVMWEEDTCSFVDVTVGVAKLQVLAHRLGERFQRTAEPGSMGRALIGVAPGDQHAFGIAMVAEFLRRDGWEVVVVPAYETAAGFLGPVQQEWFDIVAISCANDRSERDVKRLIASIRRQARNRRLGIMVGGRLPMESDAIANRVGADGWAADAQAATGLAANLAGKRSREATVAVSTEVDTSA